MARPDKVRTLIGFVTLTLALLLSGCDRMVTPRAKQSIRDADAKVAEGDFTQAITLYEHELGGSSGSADIHYKLGLLYDDKMSDPLDAVHHFKRYLALAPSGPRALDVKAFIKRDEVALLTSLSGDSIVTRAEAARLRNENLALRKDLEDQRAKAHAVTADTTHPRPKRSPAKKRSSSSH